MILNACQNHQWTSALFNSVWIRVDFWVCKKVYTLGIPSVQTNIDVESIDFLYLKYIKLQDGAPQLQVGLQPPLTMIISTITHSKIIYIST